LRIAIFGHSVFLVLLPVYTFFLHSASTYVHLFCIPTYVSWCELNAHATWLMPSHRRQNVCDFHYLRENIYIFSTCKK
jgi:hypothetical protein